LQRHQAHVDRAGLRLPGGVPGRGAQAVDRDRLDVLQPCVGRPFALQVRTEVARLPTVIIYRLGLSLTQTSCELD
jgi:hypothetical protein